MKWTHYKALMRKNWINWKRTIVGSLTEIVCPMILIGMLVGIRTLFEAEEVEASLLYRNGRIHVPVTIKNDDSYLENMREVANFSEDLMQFGNKGVPSEKEECERGNYTADDPCKEWQDSYLDEMMMNLVFDHCYQSLDK